MSKIPELLQGAGPTEESTNWKLCMICQSAEPREDTLVKAPRTDSYQRLLEAVKERASLFDDIYVQVQSRLQDNTTEKLYVEKAIWHRKCYLDATNKVHIQRARDRFSHTLSTESHTIKQREKKRGKTDIEEPDTSTSDFSAPFTRSCTAPLAKERCFFCQIDDGQQLFTVRTGNAGTDLRNAVEISQDAALQTRLNTCISPGDAHAIDVRYHKTCRRKHVFHVFARQKRHMLKQGKYASKGLSV